LVTPGGVTPASNTFAAAAASNFAIDFAAIMTAAANPVVLTELK
jgi:hypothetical protein